MPLSLVLPGYSLNSKVESRDATILVGWYTLVLHFMASFYFLDIFLGGRSDWVPSPLFEYSTNDISTIAIVLAVYCFLFMILASLGLIRGVKTETRIYYFPWLFLSAIEIIYLFYQVFHLTWRYSYDADTNLMAIIVLIFSFYHVYLYLIVISNYRFLKRIQNPTLIFPSDI